jgi:hypothetical protein
MRDLLPLLGLEVNGDVAGLTVYTRRDGRLVAFPASPPTKPASDRQIVQRTRFRVAMAAWHALDDQSRQAYTAACDALSLCLVGHNLWIALSFQPDDQLWQTIRAQSALDLVRPFHV